MIIENEKLEGIALDWVVARAMGKSASEQEFIAAHQAGRSTRSAKRSALTVTLMDTQEISASPPMSISLWTSQKDGHVGYGKTVTEAVFRCYARLKLGSAVNVPDAIADIAMPKARRPLQASVQPADDDEPINSPTY